MTLRRFLNDLIKRVQFKKRSEGDPKDLALGVARSRDSRRRSVIVLPESLRAQHLGILGLSGSGKTYFIEHLLRQDIEKKTGFVLFDVHGDLADSILAHLAERANVDPEVRKRIVLLEPFDPERSFGFNPLEEQTGVSAFLQAQEFAHILRARWRDENLGPRTEELLRNSLYTLCVNGRTLLDLQRLLTNKSTRRQWSAQLLPAINRYWTDRYDGLSARMQALFREPLLTRISSFVDDPIIRDIVRQKKSTFSFRKAFDEGLWIIINLSKGRLGANSQILGSLLFAKLELEIMSLADVPAARRRLFSVYADELQNLAGSTFGRLVAEARKYNIALVAGHQFWKQLAPPFREAMLAVGTKVLFRLHYRILGIDLAVEKQFPGSQMRLIISKKRWHEIFRVLGKRKRKRIYLFGTRADGRYRVLWAAGARAIRTFGGEVARRRRIAHSKASRNSNSCFLGVLFIHPPYRYWLTWEELRVIRKLLDRHGELVSGVLVSSEGDAAPYPVHFSKIGFVGTDMEMEDDEGFVYAQPRSALALLLRH